MFNISWDAVGTRFYEAGVDHGVLYPINTGENAAQQPYAAGVPWNGLTNVTENPSGAEASPVHADNIKYLNLMSAEDYGATIEALFYPDEFAPCDGIAVVAPGVYIGQQTRKKFGFSYRTKLGNDLDGTDYGSRIHLVYGCQASPSEKSHDTINDDPEATTMSWEVTTTPVEVTGFKPTAHLYFDSVDTDAEKFAALENILYGIAADGETEAVAARLPLPDEVIKLMGPVQAAG